MRFALQIELEVRQFLVNHLILNLAFHKITGFTFLPLDLVKLVSLKSQEWIFQKVYPLYVEWISKFNCHQSQTNMTLFSHFLKYEILQDITHQSSLFSLVFVRRIYLYHKEKSHGLFISRVLGLRKIIYSAPAITTVHLFVHPVQNTAKSPYHCHNCLSLKYKVLLSIIITVSTVTQVHSAAKCPDHCCSFPSFCPSGT